VDDNRGDLDGGDEDESRDGTTRTRASTEAEKGDVLCSEGGAVSSCFGVATVGFIYIFKPRN
jgi:hypothetical protein